MIHHLTIRRIVSDIRCKNYLKYPLSTIRPKLTIVRALRKTKSRNHTYTLHCVKLNQRYLSTLLPKWNFYICILKMAFLYIMIYKIQNYLYIVHNRSLMRAAEIIQIVPNCVETELSMLHFHRKIKKTRTQNGVVGVAKTSLQIFDISE